MYILLSVALGLISMLAYGFANAFSQPLSKNLGAAQVLFLRSFTICAIMFMASIPSLMLPHSWWAVAGTFVLGLLGYLPVLAFTHGIKTSRLGVVAPIAGTSPLITVVLAFLFLQTPISPIQWVALIMIVAANVAVSINIKNWRESNILRLSSGIPYAVFAAIGWGLFFFFFIYSTRTLGPWLGTLIAEIGVGTAAGLHIWLTRQPVKLADATRKQVILNAFLICAGTVTFAIGAVAFNVSIVAALSNSTALVAAILGAVLFHEHLTRHELIAGAAMVLGVAIIALG